MGLAVLQMTQQLRKHWRLRRVGGGRGGGLAVADAASSSADPGSGHKAASRRKARLAALAASSGFKAARSSDKAAALEDPSREAEDEEAEDEEPEFPCEEGFHWMGWRQRSPTLLGGANCCCHRQCDHARALLRLICRCDPWGWGGSDYHRGTYQHSRWGSAAF